VADELCDIDDSAKCVTDVVNQLHNDTRWGFFGTAGNVRAKSLSAGHGAGDERAEIGR